MKCTIRTTYEVITEESAEQGDAAERGWIDDKGYEVEWIDLGDGMNDDEQALREFARREVDSMVDSHPTSAGVSAVECSSSSPSPGDWITVYGNMDYEDGDYTNYSFHLDGDSELVQAILNAAHKY